MRVFEADEESNADEDMSDYGQDDGPKPSRSKLRPCKGKRNRLRKLMLRMIEQGLRDPAAFNINSVKLPPSVAASEFLREKLFSKVQSALTEILAAAQEGRVYNMFSAGFSEQGQQDMPF